jgi:hypothetical protein
MKTSFLNFWKPPWRANSERNGTGGIQGIYLFWKMCLRMTGKSTCILRRGILLAVTIAALGMKLTEFDLECRFIKN